MEEISAQIRAEFQKQNDEISATSDVSATAAPAKDDEDDEDELDLKLMDIEGE